MNRFISTRSKRLLPASWIAVALLAILQGSALVLYPVVVEQASRGGESAVAPILWLAMDHLWPIWTAAPYTFCFALALAAVASWSVFLCRRELLMTKARTAVVLVSGTAAMIGALVLGWTQVSPAWPTILLNCETESFETVVSPNGRYEARVVEVDCGAASSANRQVRITRRPWGWTEFTLLYLNDHPELRLSWSGRALTIVGERELASMARAPAEPFVWAGVLVRYRSGVADSTAAGLGASPVRASSDSHLSHNEEQGRRHVAPAGPGDSLSFDVIDSRDTSSTRTNRLRPSLEGASTNSR